MPQLTLSYMFQLSPLAEHVRNLQTFVLPVQWTIRLIGQICLGLDVVRLGGIDCIWSNEQTIAILFLRQVLAEFGKIMMDFERSLYILLQVAIPWFSFVALWRLVMWRLCLSTNTYFVMCYGQGCSGAGMRGNGVPTPFWSFALKWLWSCFKIASFLGSFPHLFCQHYIPGYDLWLIIFALLCYSVTLRDMEHESRPSPGFTSGGGQEPERGAKNQKGGHIFKI